MNQDQMLSLLRTALKLAGMFALAHGTMGVDGAGWEQLSGGILMIAPIVWDMFVHTDAGKLAAVAAMPDVKNIVVKVTATDGVAAAAADPTQPKVISTVMAKTAAVLAILILGALIVPAPGYAQTRPLTGNIVNDVRAGLKAPGSAIAAIEAKQATDITTFITNLADIEGAITLSTQIPGLQDPVGNACWLQFGPIGQLLKVHPMPLNLKVASDWEALRLLAISLNQICANPNCGQMFVDATNAVSAISPIPNAVSLQSLCAKVPVIGTSAVPTAAAPTAGIGTAAAPVATPAPAVKP